MAVPSYFAPLDAMQLALKVNGCDANIDSALTEAILMEANKFASEVLSPLNWPADHNGGCRYDSETYSVATPTGWQNAYRQFVDNGWMGISAPEAYGGQAMPATIATLVSEMWHGANMAFGLCPMLSHGATDMILAYGNDQQKDHYARKLVSGEWTGTMCLTEPQAGSDLARIATRAEPDGDTYRLTGTKIFITYGEHDLADNIIHTVLARLPDAPPGIKGLSLFIVPKFLLKADGSISDERNDVKCISIEHKLGIHGSPTCTMSFGDEGGAVGYLLGEKHQGIQAMFTMMNAARFAVGVEGIGVSEYAHQLARQYAAERVQGRGDMTIDRHPDVQRMLHTIHSHNLTLRMLSVWYASLLDAHEALQEQSTLARIELLTPILKAHCTNIASNNCTQAVQIFGGLGYIEESGIAQLLRDVTITKIYEGTNGIQALDLVFRKLPMGSEGNSGEVVKTLISEAWNHANELKSQSTGDLHTQRLCSNLIAAIEDWDKTTAWLLQQHEQSTPENTQAAQLMATDYLKLMGLVLQGWLALRAIKSTAQEASFNALLQPLRFFLDYSLHESASLRERILHGELTRGWL